MFFITVVSPLTISSKYTDSTFYTGKQVKGHSRLLMVLQKSKVLKWLNLTTVEAGTHLRFW